jgi:hypothetical protein
MSFSVPVRRLKVWICVQGRTPMASYQVYVHDDRCATPQLRLTLVTDEIRLKEITQLVLAESRHYEAVEVFDQNGRPFGRGAGQPNGALRPLQAPS